MTEYNAQTEITDNSDSCPLCGGQRNEFRFHDAGVDVVACMVCDLLFISPYPTCSEDVYETVADYDYEDLAILSAERHYEASKRLYDESFPRLIREFEGVQSVLDVGCGTGHLLERIGKLDVPVRVGLELNRDRAAFARRVANCEIYEEPLEVFAPSRQFDVVLMMDLIAHVPNLRSFLQSAIERLSPGGKLIMRVGEYSRHVNRLTHFDWQIPDHLQFLGVETADFIAGEFQLVIAFRDRVPLADEMFSKRAWLAKGRNDSRNRAKRIVVNIPGLLNVIRGLYRMTAGRGHFASVIIFEKPESE